MLLRVEGRCRQHRFPIRSARFDPKLGDQQVDHLTQRDDAGWDVHRTQGDLAPRCHVDWRHAGGEVQVRRRHRATAFRMPVVGENFSSFRFENAIAIPNNPRLVGVLLVLLDPVANVNGESWTPLPAIEAKHHGSLKGNKRNTAW